MQRLKNTFLVTKCSNRPMGDTKSDHSGKESFVDVKQRWFQVTSVSLINFLPFDLRVISKFYLFESVKFFLDTTCSFAVNSGTLRDCFLCQLYSWVEKTNSRNKLRYLFLHCYKFGGDFPLNVFNRQPICTQAF